MMRFSKKQASGVGTGPGRSPRWPWAFAGCCLAVLILACYLHRLVVPAPQTTADGTRGKRVAGATTSPAGKEGFKLPHGNSTAGLPQTAEQIVAGKVSQFGRSRRELVHALAHRVKVPVREGVERFFDAVESGN